MRLIYFNNGKLGVNLFEENNYRPIKNLNLIYWFPILIDWFPILVDWFPILIDWFPVLNALVHCLAILQFQNPLIIQEEVFASF